MSKKDVFKSLVNRKIIEITIPSSAKSVGNRAFCFCKSLTNVTIPSSVTSIDEYAFNNCDSLTNITIPNSVVSIGDAVFTSCDSLTNITIPNSVTSFGERVFNNSSGALTLKTITFNQPSGMVITLPSAGSSTGLFYCKTASTLTVYTDNETIKNYDYATDNVTPTFYHLDGTLWE